MAPFSTYKPTHNPQFPQSLRLRANARNVIVSLKTLHDGQFTFSTQLITLNYPVILSHRRSTTVSLETYPLNLFLLVRGESLFTLRKNEAENLDFRNYVLLDVVASVRSYAFIVYLLLLFSQL